MDGIRNVYIFVADALRWDYLPESMRSRGVALKTVSSSTLSPTSFASIVSGLHPPQHGVWTFGHRLREEHAWLLHSDEFEGSFWQSSEDDPIFTTLGQDPEPSRGVDDVEPPFVTVERELVTHSPYGIREEDSDSDYSAIEFIDEHSRSLDELRERYEKGARRAGEIFEMRLETLADRSLLEETLVVFTSDHGELLGEYGAFSHVHPVVPESVYVPTVIVSPDTDESIRDGLFSHVDLLPTVADALDIEIPYDTPGESAFAEMTRPHAYCGYRLPDGFGPFGESSSRFDRYDESTHSIWDDAGGWAFDHSPVRQRIVRAITHTLPTSPRTRHAYVQNTGGLLGALPGILRSATRSGQPGFDKATARRLVTEVTKGNQTGARRDELGDAELQRLSDLGYVE